MADSANVPLVLSDFFWRIRAAQAFKMRLGASFWSFLGTLALTTLTSSATRGSRTIIDAAQLKAIVQDRQFRPKHNGRAVSALSDVVTKVKRQEDSGSCPP